MTWDPDGIVVGDAFAGYVEDLRETSNYAAGGGNAHFSDDMNDTPSDEDAQVATTAAADREMTRRAFAVTVGAAAATAAGAGSVSAQEEGSVPNFSGEYTPIPKVVGTRISVEEHSPEMGQLDYVDNDGNVKSLTEEFGAVLEPDPENDGEGHNPVTFDASMIDSAEYTAFPRGVTRTNADDEEEDVSALDAQEWTTDESNTTGSITVSDAEDALSVSTAGQTSGDTATATFSNFTIDSGEQRKMLQLVLDVDTLESGAVVDVEVVDAGGASVVSTIDPSADAAADATIATEQASGVVHQVEIGALSGGADLDTLEEIVVSVSEANAAVTLHGLNLELDTEWTFGTREVYDSENDEVTEESLLEPTGRTGIVSLTSLTNQFTDATIAGVEYDVELRSAEAPASNWEVEVTDVDRGSYESRFKMVGGLELPGGLYEVEVAQPGTLVDEVRHPDDVYQTVEYAHDQPELPVLDDVEDISWTDATTVLEGGDMEAEVTLSETVSAGDTIGLHYIITESEELVSSMVGSTGGGGGPALSSGDGGIMSNLWAWVAALGTGAIGAFALVRRRAANAVPGGN